jgi:hypothetical protein
VLAVSRAGYYQHQQRGPRQSDVVATVELKVADNLPGRQFAVAALNQAWTADIT